MRQIAATRRRDRLLQQIASCDMWKSLSLRSVARIQTGLNSCDVSQRQNKHKQPCRTVCTHLRQVAATKFKSTNEETSISFQRC